MSTLTDEDLSRLLEESASSYGVPAHGPTEILAALAGQPATPLYRRRWLQLSSAAAAVTVGLVFAASLGSGSGGGESASSPTAVTADRGLAQKGLDTRAPINKGMQPDTAFAPGAPAPVAAAPRQGHSSSGSATGSGMSSVGGGVGGGTPGSAAAPLVNAPATDEGQSRVVKTGTIALIVRDKQVSPILRAVSNAAKAEGGYVAASSTNEYGDNPAGEVSIRVPVARFEGLVDRIRGLDAKVRTASMSGKDVTAAYADLEVQLRTLKATRERFLLILSKTQTISEILAVQQRVDGVSGQIDRLEGQRKLLGSQSDLSTLTVSVSQDSDPAVTVTQRRSGLAQALADAKAGFVGGVEAIIRNSGGALLFLIVLAAGLLVGRLGWRVARRRMV